MKRIAITSCILFSASLLFAQLVPQKQEVPAKQRQETTDSFYLLTPVEVKAIRAGEKAPFTRTNLSKKEIEKNNLGQDIPFLLNQTPSVVVNSDAGNGIGYTGLRIRGVDATRINVTLNGIPYNDAESQGTFFVDLPDFISSVSSIQIQRGVGTSSNGAGAFGATISLSTNETNIKPYAELNNSYGSFNTWKNTLKAGTGLIDNRFSIDARLSRITSDGFIDRASSDLKSFYISGAWYLPKSSLRLNIFSGQEKTYQAWNGIPQYKLFNNKDSLLQHYYFNQGYYYFTPEDSANLFDADARKFNMFLYPNQTDNYQQDHYQLFFNHSFNDRYTFNLAAFLSKGKGYYEELKRNEAYLDYGLPNPTIGGTVIEETDLIRQLWLDNNFYGGIFSLQYKKNNNGLTVGGALTQYDGKHYGIIKWAQNGGIPNDYRWYYYTAYKSDFNTYIKWQHRFTPKLEMLADLQYRNVSYKINGTRKFPDMKVNEQFNFLNPKIGLTYSEGSLSYYVSYAMANKEPNRNDYETGTVKSKPQAERLHDIELGIEQKRSQLSWAANLYYMNYDNQLVLVGKINDVGDPVRINVPESYRLGIELQGNYKITKVLNIGGNIAFSSNKIMNFIDNIPVYNADFDLIEQKELFYKKTTMALSPSVVAGAMVEVLPLKNISVALIGKYAGEQYLDNTENQNRKINSYFVSDLRMSYTVAKGLLKESNLILQINNLWNKKYESNGYTYSYIYDTQSITENFYYPMAGTNFMIGMNIKL